RAQWHRRLSVPSHHRLTDIFGAFDAGLTITEINELSHIDLWFLENLQELWEESTRLTSGGIELDRDYLLRLKRLGFGDKQIAACLSSGGKSTSEDQVFKLRTSLGVRPTYKTIDTCAAEFQATTPYLYSTYEDESEVPP